MMSKSEHVQKRIDVSAPYFRPAHFMSNKTFAFIPCLTSLNQNYKEIAFSFDMGD